MRLPRHVLVLFGAALFVLAACSEPGVAPNDPLARAPTIQLTHLGGDPATDDLCGGFSPCDAYDYNGDGKIGAPGMCFLPPTVDNHLSDPACSAPNTPGLSGIFSLAWCRVEYLDGTSQPPSIAQKEESPGVFVPDCADGQPLVEESGHYAASVRWTRGMADDLDIFRVYVVRGHRVFAHRDLIINPNFTPPADGYVHAIGYGNEPIKLVITEDFSCIKYDTQNGADENAATCLISGAEEVTLDTDIVRTTFNFREGNPTFLADFEVSECLSLGFDYDDATGQASGNALVDTPLANCKISLSSEEIDRLTVPAQITIDLSDARWAEGGPFEHARVNVLQYDEHGIGALPPSDPKGWFGLVTSNNVMLRWLGRGVDKLAALILPEPLYAAYRGGGTWDLSRMSDFQVSVQGVMAPPTALDGCDSGEAYCYDLGTFGGENPSTSVSVKVSAPDSMPVTSQPLEYPDHYFAVPDTRLHFFPEKGEVSCPTGSAQDPDTGRGCVPPNTPDVSTTPSSLWPDHFVYITEANGIATVDWALTGDGEHLMRVSACGVARPGPNEPDALDGDNVWGDLGFCTDRELAAMASDTAFDNGPADGFTPFEPVDTQNEVAIYGRPLEFVARTCPAIDVTDGLKDAAWEACATKTIFTAPQKGPKVENNAALYTYSDGTALYIGVEVNTTEIGNRIFVNLTETAANGDGVERDGDELLVVDQFATGNVGVFSDWHFTQQCVGNNASSLCGEADGSGEPGFEADGAGKLGGAGSGTVFYEFMRPFDSPNAAAGPDKEDLAAGFGSEIGLRVTVTQGQGGGKGGFVYPDPQTGGSEYHVFTIR